MRTTPTHIITLVILTASLTGVACAPRPHTGNSVMNTTIPAIIPAPVRLDVGTGRFNLVQGATMAFHPAFAGEARLLAEQCGLRLASPLDSSARVVMLLLDGYPDEGYELAVVPDGVLIKASTPRGAWWAGQTLRQLLLDGRDLPVMTIVDEPRFPWRGMLLDCGRQMMSVAYVKRAIDRLALHRMNVLHWHLTEDQGWRLEIEAYPRLTDIGAWRTSTSGEPEGGFYTRDQVRDIVAYAAARHVTVVPEIELPGHSQAALAAYPELSCTGGPFEVQTQWGIFPDVFCAGNDSVFEFLTTVLSEVLDLFPSRFIHIGGDETPKTRWKECERCQERIVNEGLKDEHELQSWFVGRIGDWLDQRGRRLIGWDEILEGGLPDGAAVQSWRGMNGAIAAVRAGHDAVVSPTSHCYLDYPVSKTSLRQCYAFEPVPAGLTEAEASRILGGEANMWTEYAPEDVVDTKIWPRLTAIAERLWSPVDRRDFNDFRQRWLHHRHRLDALGVAYGPAADPVTTRARYEPGLDAWIIDPQSSEPGLDLVAGTSEHPPRPLDQRVLKPFLVRDQADVVIQAYLGEERWGLPALETLSRHAGLGRTPAMLAPPSPRYPGDNDNALVDGLHGSTDHHDGRWLGFEGVDMVASIDLGKPIHLASVAAGFLQDINAWIFPPNVFTVEGSLDGRSWTNLGSTTHGITDRDQNKQIWTADIDVRNSVVRHVRLTATSSGPCPDRHPGAGRESWIFCDEITVNEASVR